MASSMTGYSSFKKNFKDKEIHLEIKSVNGKHCDVKIGVENHQGDIETLIIKKIKSLFGRGTFRVNVNIDCFSDKNSTFEIDSELLKSYKNSLDEISKKLKIKNDLGMKDMIRLPNVIKINKIKTNLSWEEIEPILDKAIEKLKKSRLEEGKNLIKDILERIKLVSNLAKEISKLDKGRIKKYKEKIQNRLNKLMINSSMDDERLEKEIAIYSDRIDITEELVRISSHIKEFKKKIKEKGIIGKSLDFRIQELMREFNTISNKCNDTDISNCVVNCKGELEKIREQVQNIE